MIANRKPQGDTLDAGDMVDNDATLAGASNGALDGLTPTSLKRGYSKEGSAALPDTTYDYRYPPGSMESGWVRERDTPREG